MLFASDLDGTLLGPDSELSARTIETLGEVRAQGAEVIAVTGRAPHTALPRLQGCGVLDVALCNNGAVHLDVATGTVVSATTLPVEPLAELLADLERLAPGIGLAWETADGFEENEAFCQLGFRLETSGLHAPFEGVPDAASLHTSKLAIAHRDFGTLELLAHLDAHLDTEFALATSGAPFLEATAPGVDKGTALARYCAERGIAQADVVAYGDNHNDVPMLRWAGTGVAVDNAHPLAVAAADTRIGHHADDSVALDMLRRASAK